MTYYPRTMVWSNVIKEAIEYSQDKWELLWNVGKTQDVVPILVSEPVSARA